MEGLALASSVRATYAARDGAPRTAHSGPHDGTGSGDPAGQRRSVLVLNEIVHAPEGRVAQVITPFDLHFRKKTRKGFKEVLINPKGTRLPIGKAATKTAPTPETL